MTTININQLVTAVLTPDGVRVMVEKRGNKTLRFEAATRTIRAELWQIMHIFGESHYIGCPAVFVGNSLTITPSAQDAEQPGPTDEHIEQAAKAMWDAHFEGDAAPAWDELTDMDESIKREMRVRTKAAIEEWLRITKPSPCSP